MELSLLIASVLVTDLVHLGNLSFENIPEARGATKWRFRLPEVLRSENSKRTPSQLSDVGNGFLGLYRSSRGLHTRGFHNLDRAFDYGIRVVYWGSHLPDYPVSDGTMLQYERNLRIRDAYAAGAAVPDLVREHQISPQRVYQILRGN